MGALQRLQRLQQTHIATHDSIGTGEDGPTHQPIALAALYRAMPNLLYIRPCDSEETAGALIAAPEATDSPNILSLSRQALEQYSEHPSQDGVLRGAYVFIEEETPDVTLLGVGAEMCFAVQRRDELAKHGITARVVSFPCQRLFQQQPIAYRRQVLGSASRVVIEAYAVKRVGAVRRRGLQHVLFGKSLPGKDAYAFFSFEAGSVATKLRAWLDDFAGLGAEGLRSEFADLNDVPEVITEE
jgi:dihydroxyacetone synthase